MANFFSRGGLTLDRLHTLLAVSEAGGITAAAPGKPSLQSQMSRQIAELEQFFERQLVERRGKGIALTADGQQLAMIVRDSFTALRDFGATPVVAPLDVLVGAGDSVIRWWLIPQGAAFDPARVQVSAMSGEEIVAGLLDAKLDFGIVRASELHSGLSSRVLGNVDYALYVPAALLPEGKHHRVKDLVQRVPIGVLNGEPSFSARLEAGLSRAGVRLTPSCIFETFPQVHAAVVAGRCAAVLPTLARAELPRSGFHEFQSPILGKHDVRMCLAWTPRLERQRPRVAELIPRIVEGMQR
jgi:DNA-binding transcriptional LysR family regulator